MLLQLPHDVLQLLVEGLAQDADHNWTEIPYQRPDRRNDATLCSLALTNRALCSVVQPLQFRKVCLDNLRRAMSFQEVISRNPGISPFIETLEIDADMGADMHTTDLRSLGIGVHGRNSSWISWLWSRDPETRVILSRLTNVTTLVVTRWEGKHPVAIGEICWGIDALSKILPQVTCIRFRFNWYFRPCLWVKALGKWILTGISIDGSNILVRTTLDAVVMEGLAKLSSADVPNLTSFYTSYEGLFGVCDDSFSNLVQSGWGIPNLPNLSSLDLDMRATSWNYFKRIERRASLDPFIRYLSDMGDEHGSLKLRRLSLRFVDGRTMLYDDYDQDPRKQVPSVAPHLICHALDSLLVTNKAFRGVYLTVSLACIMYTYEEMQLRIHVLLPQLQAENRLTVCREHVDQNFDDIEM